MMPERWAAGLAILGVLLFVVCFPGCCAAGLWTGSFFGGLVSFLVLVAAIHHLFLDQGRTFDGDRVLDDLRLRYTFEDTVSFHREEEGSHDRIVLALALLDRTALPEGGSADLWAVLDPSVVDGDASGESDDGGIDGGGD